MVYSIAKSNYTPQYMVSLVIAIEKYMKQTEHNPKYKKCVQT